MKTYPNPSQKYGETVCCAGVDLDTHEWVRIYPVNFRRLADRKFAKYQVIECQSEKPRNDRRPESRRVDQDSIKLMGPPMPAGPKGWRARMAALPPLERSMEAIREAHRVDRLSLAALRPAEIMGLVIEPSDPWDAAKLRAVRQQRLALGEDSAELRELEQLPFRFRYRFRCDDERCKTHTMGIFDWEIGEAYRRWRREYRDGWQRAIRQKFEVQLPATDLHLVVGTMQAHPHTFVIVGLIYPPRAKVQNRAPGQLALKLLYEE